MTLDDYIQSSRYRWHDCVAYIVATGPSLAVFPVDFLQDELVIGVNQVWRRLPHVDLLVTVKTISNYVPYVAEGGTNVSRWLIRDAPGVNPVPEADNVLSFWAPEVKRGNWGALSAQRKPNELFYWGGGQSSAMHLAALLGCRAIVLVAGDCCALDEDMHFIKRTDTIATLESRQRLYGRYQEATRALRTRLRQEFNIPVLSLTPFVGLPGYEDDYKLLKQELKKV